MENIECPRLEGSVCPRNDSSDLHIACSSLVLQALGRESISVYSIVEASRPKHCPMLVVLWKVALMTMFNVAWLLDKALSPAAL